MLNDYYEFNIAGHYLPALINDDFTGLSDNEAKEVDSFIIWGLKQLPDMTATVVDEEGENFCQCEISGLYAQCYTVRFYFTNENIPAEITQ
jgi:hypothetical protein